MPFDTASVVRNKEIHDLVKLSFLVALLGEIPRNIRAFGVGYDDVKKIVKTVAVYDVEYNDEEFEDISSAITEASSHFIDIKPLEEYPLLDEEYLVVPYPESLAPYCPNWGWVYLRKENQFNIDFGHDELQAISRVCFEVIHRIKLNEHQQKMLVHVDYGAGTEEKVNQLLNGHPGYRPLFLIEELLFIREAVMVLIANSIEGDVRRFGGTVEDLILVNHRLDQAFLRYSR